MRRAALALAAAACCAVGTDEPAPMPHTRAERPSRLYPRDVPGCVTAGKDHHCRMKTYGNGRADDPSPS